MEGIFVKELFFVLCAALVGGLSVRILRLQPIIGYIIAGIIVGAVIPTQLYEIERLAEIGAILLLFSIGIELSLERLSKMYKVAVIGGVLQILVTTLVAYVFLNVLGFDTTSSLIMAFGFSLSSTAVVVKILSDRGEMDTIHGGLMHVWLLVQDLAIIPAIVIMSSLSPGGSEWLLSSMLALTKAIIIIATIVILGRFIIPKIIHKVASYNSRELLVIASIVMALGIAYIASLFGISPALGALLAGIAISESQEKHAVFAETRPLRDLFVALFFVSLGFLVDPEVLASNIFLILGIVTFIVVVKFIVFLVISFSFKFHGKTAIQASLGLAEIGEFSFIILSVAVAFGLMTKDIVAIGVAVTLVSLLITPFLFRLSVPLWRKLKILTANNPGLHKYFVGWDRKSFQYKNVFEDHVVICGFGRVGEWVGKALDSMNMNYLVIDYNQQVVSKAREKGISIIYGDPSEKEVLQEASFEKAKVLVIAIPDRVTQEELITTAQTINPKIKIVTRTHYDKDWDRLKFLRVDKIVQPEFEAAVGITRYILQTFGQEKRDIDKKITGLRHSRAIMKV